MTAQTSIRFSHRDKKRFFRTLNKRINSYFKENDISRKGNWQLYCKTFVMFSLYLTPYFLVLSLNISQWWMLLLTVVMGIGMAGVGMNVMHDGNHGAYSTKKWINKIMGGSMYILAGNVYNWQVQHNVLHHTYTNIQGHDEDLEAGRILRFSKHAKWRSFHKFQHLYSILLYGLLTFNWALTTDFRQTHRYLKRKLSYGKMPNAFKQWSTVVIGKLVYLSVWILIPMLFIEVAWWKILIGFFVMHYTAGLILSVIFQLAHVVEDVDMPLPNQDGSMENTWAIHQLFTTVNFSPNNRLMGWFTGGLNYQIEHHIYPNICHVHYRKMAKIIQETAEEFDLPYHQYQTTRKAIAAHFRHLKEMGVKPAVSL